MQFSKRLTVIEEPVEITQEQWEQARRETAAAMVEEFGEAAAEHFLRSVGSAPPSFITIKDFKVE